MDIFDLLKEVIKGIVCAISAHLFRTTFLDKEKTTQAVTSRVVLIKINHL